MGKPEFGIQRFDNFLKILIDPIQEKSYPVKVICDTFKDGKAIFIQRDNWNSFTETLVWSCEVGERLGLTSSTTKKVGLSIQGIG